MWSKSIIVLLFSFFLTKPACSQIKLLLKKTEVSVFAYQKGDEFNSEKLNEKFWLNGSGGRSVLMSQNMAFLNNLVVCNGKEVLLLAKNYDTLVSLQDWEIDREFLKRNKLKIENNKWNVKYAVGSIVSREKFSYGYHEARFKIQDNQGTWPAFWFYGGDRNEEIDVFELKGENQKNIHIDVHCPSGCDHGYKKRAFDFYRSYGGWLKISDSLSSGYQVMGVEWNAKELIFYLNGDVISYFRGNFGNKMNVRLNTSVAKDGEAFSPGPNKLNQWPDTFAVDYYRYWAPVKLSDTIPLLNTGVLNVTEFGKSVPLANRGTTVNKKKAESFLAEVNLIRTDNNHITVSPSSSLDTYVSSIIISQKGIEREIKNFESPSSIAIQQGLIIIEIIEKSGRKSRFTVTAP